MARDLDDEVRFHLEARITDLCAKGRSRSEAEAEALRQFGDIEELRRYCGGLDRRSARRARVLEWLDQAAQDLYHTGRQIRRAPTFAAIAVLTLALGIGANTAIFTVVHRLLLAPLPYPDGNRIVMLQVDRSRFDTPLRPVVQAWLARSRALEDLAAVAVDAVATADTAEQDTIHAFITANYLHLLGLHPAIGRAFTPEDERPGGQRVAMISYGFWQGAYGGRASALGSVLRVDSLSYTIVGVAPRGMGLPMESKSFRMNVRAARPGIWLPAPLDSMADGGLYAKLRPGMSANQASGELEEITHTVPTPIEDSIRVRAVRAQDLLEPREAQTVRILFVAVGVLLLIACANVANLLLSRAWTRRREFAVRVALGAPRRRLVRQVLTESVALAIAGGLLGVGVAWGALRAIIALRPPALEHLAGIHVEPVVLLWSVGISVATGLLFGCVPALLVGSRALGNVLRGEATRGSGGVGARRIRSGLIVFQIATSLVLLVGAGLLARSFVGLERMPLGCDPRGLVSINVLLPPRIAPARRVALRTAIIERLRAIPGVAEAAVGTLPGDGYGAHEPLETEPDASGYSRSVPAFSPSFVSANYFRVARMSLIAGRLPDPATVPSASDTAWRTKPQEVVVNTGLVRRFWPDGRVLGSRLYTTTTRGRQWQYTVVGVVDDVHMPGARPDIKNAEIYQLPLPIFGFATFVVRTPMPPAQTAAALRRAVLDINQRIYIETVTTGDQYLSNALAPTHFAMALLAAFAIVALVLSAIGLYGVVSYTVSQRTREIGVRIALGARPSAITGLVVGGGLRLAIGGVLVGLAVAAASTPVLASLLYGVSPFDPLTFVGIGVLIAAVALLASCVPARRALRIDPSDALRAE